MRQKITEKKTGLLLLLLIPLFFSCAEPWDYSAPRDLNNPVEVPDVPVSEKLLTPLTEPVSAAKAPVVTSGADTLTIDFQTTEAENEKLTGVFNNSPTVRYSKENRTMLRADGLLGNPAEMNGLITELITHYHTDHVTRSVVERCLREGSFKRLIAPYPFLDASRTAVFSLIAEREEQEGLIPVSGDNIKLNDPVMDITGGGNNPVRSRSGIIGDFFYSSFTVNEDIRVEMFKYQKPRNVNADGLIFRVSHKSVSYLLFGDFDDPAGIDKLLDIFLEYGIKCDIIKWPHHAHKFPNNEWADGIIKKMNDVVDPRFIIWQRHPTQNGFREYITRFDFVDKFLCSGDMEIIIISLYLNEEQVRPAFRARIEHFFLFG